MILVLVMFLACTSVRTFYLHAPPLLRREGKVAIVLTAMHARSQYAFSEAEWLLSSARLVRLRLDFVVRHRCRGIVAPGSLTGMVISLLVDSLLEIDIKTKQQINTSHILVK